MKPVIHVLGYVLRFALAAPASAVEYFTGDPVFVKCVDHDTDIGLKKGDAYFMVKRVTIVSPQNNLSVQISPLEPKSPEIAIESTEAEPSGFVTTVLAAIKLPQMDAARSRKDAQALKIGIEQTLRKGRSVRIEKEILYHFELDRGCDNPSMADEINRYVMNRGRERRVLITDDVRTIRVSEESSKAIYAPAPAQPAQKTALPVTPAKGTMGSGAPRK